AAPLFHRHAQALRRVLPGDPHARRAAHPLCGDPPLDRDHGRDLPLVPRQRATFGVREAGQPGEWPAGTDLPRRRTTHHSPLTTHQTMKAVVTGATGFLGRRLVRQLLADGHEVRCLVRPASDLAGLRQDIDSQRTARLEIAQGTLGRIDRSPEVFENCDVVYHLAAALTGPAAVLFLDNVVATRKLIDVAGRSSVKRFVLVSSLAVHGVSHLKTGDVLDETCPLDTEPHQRDAYTYSKIVQEQA